MSNIVLRLYRVNFELWSGLRMAKCHAFVVAASQSNANRLVHMSPDLDSYDCVLITSTRSLGIYDALSGSLEAARVM